ncbi:tubulin folding cofactor D C terminal-domain-containing protein [Spinellus fusiger]|nr:tubulin folding cofactor D C terminal-domain-containing protein [Spinellus fusiger]
MTMDVDEQGEQECIYQTRAHFEHIELVTQWVNILVSNDHTSGEQTKALKSLSEVFDLYQEQAHLLDHHLETLIEPVIAKLRIEIDTWGQTHQQVSTQTYLLFRYLYLLTKTRGYKTIVKFMSHGADDLEPVFEFLCGLDPKDNATWEMRYISFIWLSLICMVPFDLRKIDSGGGEGYTSLVVKMLDVCKQYLRSTGKERDSAGILVARLLSRRDHSSEHLLPYIEWCRERLSSDSDIFETSGILMSLCATYQLSPREVLLPTLDDYITPLLTMPFFNKFADNTLVRKLRTKLTQRVGLCYLRPKIASWRYQRGNRSLGNNLGVSTENESDTLPQQQHRQEEEEEEEEDISENLEVVFEILLTALKDRDTIVRWSAAKGIGRMAQRLPLELAEDVIGTILELFEENTYTHPTTGQLDMTAVSENTWHGASLAIAELARRGLLLPERLESTLPWIIHGLTFDLKRGSHSIGAHVRDAACYVCWSFARAYAPEILEPYVERIAQKLVVVSVFDREINIRRASSAAFQENVGRQGIFPRGIDIIQTADYFTVGNRTNAFLNVAIEIAKLDDYRYPLIHHLVTVTSKHWDKSMRTLASKAFYSLTALDPIYTMDMALPALIPSATSKDLQISHGAILAIGEIVLALYKCRQEDPAIERHWQSKEEDIKSIAQIVSLIPPRSLTTFGSEHVCEAICHMIECLSNAHFPCFDLKENTTTLETWKKIVHVCLERKEENVQEHAVVAFGAIVKTYSITKEEIDICMDKLGSVRMIYSRRGYALALGTLDYTIKERVPWLSLVLEKLYYATRKQEEQYANDAESKRNAVIGLTSILKSFGDQLTEFISVEQFRLLLFTLETCLMDYSMDQRGDVGSWTRMASMECMRYMVPLVASSDAACSYLSTEDVQRVIAIVMKQGVERIDRVRANAGSVLRDFLYPALNGGDVWAIEIPYKEYIQKYITPDLSWASPNILYPSIVNILSLPVYRYELLIGLISSAGGLTESLVRYSSGCLVEYLNGLPLHSEDASSVSLVDISTTLLSIFTRNERYDRIIIPLLDVVGLLYESDILSKLPDDSIHTKMFVCTRKESFRCKSMKKLNSTIKVYTGLIGLYGTQTKTKALQQMLSYLVHAFPKIRTETAEQLYTFVSLLEDSELTEAMEEAEQILTSTDW